MATPGTGAVHRERMLRVRRTASFGVMVSDTARGVVRSVRGRPLVRYDLHPEDAERFRRGFQLLARIWWAAGAREVVVPLHGVPVLRDSDSGRLQRARAPARRAGDGLPPARHRPRRGRPGAQRRRRSTCSSTACAACTWPTAAPCRPPSGSTRR